MSPASSVSAPVPRCRAALSVDHAVGDLGILDAEGAAEAAADLRRSASPSSVSPPLRQEPARLLLDAELAQARAGIVIGGDAVVARGDARRAADIDQERDELVGLRGQLLGALAPAPDRRRTARDNAAAACRRRSPRAPRHSRSRLESGDHLARDRLGVGAVAGIIGGLAAAGLRGAAPRRCSPPPRAA